METKSSSSSVQVAVTPSIHTDQTVTTSITATASATVGTVGVQNVLNEPPPPPTTTTTSTTNQTNKKPNSNNNNKNKNNNKKQRRGGASGGSKPPKNPRRATTTELLQIEQQNEDGGMKQKNSSSNNNNDHFHIHDEYASRSRNMNRGSYAHDAQRQLYNITLPDHHYLLHHPNNSNNDVISNGDKQNDDDNNPERDDDDEKRSKKKVTMLIGYLGTRYGGFQINEGVRSIQSEIELALYTHQYINRTNFGYPQKYHWSTSGRTDRGVHAAAQVVSFKMELLATEIPNDALHTLVVQQLNDVLPHDIRIFDICRTVKSFSAKLQRDYVRYRYLIPAVCFYPRDSLNHIFETTIASSPVSTTTTTAVSPPVAVPLGFSKTISNGGDDNGDGPTDSSAQQQQQQPFWHILPNEVRQIYDQISNYRTTAEQRQILQSTAKQYIGTHSFHNFTKRCTYNEARSSRYIMDFIVEEPIIIKTLVPDDGTGNGSKTYEMEWIPTTIIGQSFLLNQIRKMIWLAIEIARGAVPETTLQTALRRIPQHQRQRQHQTSTKNENENENKDDTTDPPIRIGMAPAQGLFLDMSYYNNYNEKIERTKNSNQTNHNADAVAVLDWHIDHTIANQRWKEFRNTIITQHIGQEEVQYGNFIQQIYMQEYRSYFYSNTDDDFNEKEDEEEDGKDENDESGGEID